MVPRAAYVTKLPGLEFVDWKMVGLIIWVVIRYLFENLKAWRVDVVNGQL